jgi:hypothetical protein
MIEGLLCLGLGISFILFTIKYPAQKPSSLDEDYAGFIGGGGLVFLGIVLIVRSCS